MSVTAKAQFKFYNLHILLDFIIYTFLLIPNTISPSKLPWDVDILVMIPTVEKRLRGSETFPGSPAGGRSSWPSPFPGGVFLSHSPVRTCLISASRPPLGQARDVGPATGSTQSGWEEGTYLDRKYYKSTGTTRQV